MFKGWMAVYYARLFHSFEAGSQNLESFGIFLGALAVAGHIFPVYAGFRGGKGVATVFGALLAIHPFATLAAGGSFIVAVAITRIISVGSMVAGISFPIWIILVFKTDNPVLLGFSLIVALGLLATHHQNIGRLLRGEEKKASWLVRKK